MGADLLGYERGALLSDCGRYRWLLWRVWDLQKPRVLWCMFNPSTADATKDDPTITLITRISEANGYGALEVVNMLPVRSPDPQRAMAWHAAGHVAEHRQNRDWMRARAAACARTVAAWGALPYAPGLEELRADALQALRTRTAPLLCVRPTAAGYPTHPLARGRHKVAPGTQLQAWLEVSG